MFCFLTISYLHSLKNKLHEKIAFLKGMFDFNLIGRFDGTEVHAADAEEMDYYAILNTIINGKWEG